MKPQKTIRGYDGSFGGTIASAGFSMQATFQHEYQEPRGRLHWPRLRMRIRYALFPTTLYKAVPEPAEIKQCREDRAYTPCNRNRPALSRCDRPWFGVCRSAGCGPDLREREPGPRARDCTQLLGPIVSATEGMLLQLMVEQALRPGSSTA